MKEFKPAPKFTPTFLKETRRLKSGKRKELEKVVLKEERVRKSGAKNLGQSCSGKAVKIFFQVGPKK